MKKIFVIDDHPIVQQGLAQLFSAEADLTLCGQVTRAQQALQQVRASEPDLVVLDLSLEGLNGLDLIKDLRAFLPRLPVLVYSMHDELIYAERALRAGAQGYVMKMSSTEHMLKAIRALLRGEVFISEAITKRTVHRLGGSPVPDGKGRSAVDSLSDRELQVLQYIGQGKRTRTIADELHISVKTVDSHRMNLKEKLGLVDSQAVLRFAIEWARHSEPLHQPLVEKEAG